MKTMRIGEVAKQAKVSVETVRYYERQGLLKEPPRRASEYREYDDDTVALLRFISRANELGFTLKEIGSLMQLRSDASATQSQVRRQAKNKLAAIEAKITDLQRMRDALLLLLETCHGDGPAGECPIIESLQGSDLP